MQFCHVLQFLPFLTIEKGFKSKPCDISRYKKRSATTYSGTNQGVDKSSGLVIEKSAANNYRELWQEYHGSDSKHGNIEGRRAILTKVDEFVEMDHVELVVDPRHPYRNRCQDKQQEEDDSWSK